MSQYSATTLDVTASFMGENIPVELTNVSWNGNSFNALLDGISVSGTDSNGNITATGYYCGNKYSASGSVTGWN